MSSNNGRHGSWLARALSNVVRGLRTVDSGFENRMLSEAYSRIMHELAMLPGEDTKVVLITSAVENEGASTVARQLAAALAKSQSGRVLLIDAAEKPARSSEAAGPMTALLPLGAEAEDAFVRTSDGFSVLPYDGDAPEHYSLRRGVQLAHSLRNLAKRFDWMVIDGRPITQHTETAALSSEADATVLVLRAESTRSQVANRALDILRGADAHVVGGVLNRRKYHIPDVLYRRL